MRSILDTNAKPYFIMGEDCGARVLAHLWQVPQGIVFADIGWPGSPGHPFHLIEGNFNPDTLEIGDYEIGQIPDCDEQIDEWHRWQAWLKSGEGVWATEERARKAAIASLSL